MISIDLLPPILTTNMPLHTKVKHDHMILCRPSTADLMSACGGISELQPAECEGVVILAARLTIELSPSTPDIMLHYVRPTSSALPGGLTHRLRSGPALKHNCIMDPAQVCALFPGVVVITSHISQINVPAHAHEILF